MFAKPEHELLKILARMEPEFTGLSTFDPFPDGNASQVDTKARFGSKLLPVNSGSIRASIFSSSCYGFANITAPLPQRLVFGSM